MEVFFFWLLSIGVAVWLGYALAMEYIEYCRYSRFDNFWDHLMDKFFE